MEGKRGFRRDVRHPGAMICWMIPGEYYHPLHRVTGLPPDGPGRSTAGAISARPGVEVAVYARGRPQRWIRSARPSRWGREAIRRRLAEPRRDETRTRSLATPSTPRRRKVIRERWTNGSRVRLLPAYDVTVPDASIGARRLTVAQLQDGAASAVICERGVTPSWVVPEHDLGEGKGSCREGRRRAATIAPSVGRGATRRSTHEDLLEFAEATQVLDDETEAQPFELSEAEAVARLERR